MSPVSNNESNIHVLHHPHQKSYTLTRLPCWLYSWKSCMKPAVLQPSPHRHATDCTNQKCCVSRAVVVVDFSLLARILGECGWVFPDKLHVSSFPDTVIGSHTMPGQPHSQPTPTSLGQGSTCVCRCNLPPALLAEWLASFTCHCGDMGIEWTPIKSQHSKLTQEENILPPLLPGFELTAFQSWVRCSTNELSRTVTLQGFEDGHWIKKKEKKKKTKEFQSLIDSYCHRSDRMVSLFSYC